MPPSIEALRVSPAAMVVRLVAGAFFFGALALVWERALLAYALPVFSAWIGFWDNTFHTVDLRVRDIKGELFMVRVATPAVIHVLGSHVIAADPHAFLPASVSAGIVLQPPVLAAALLCAWPWRRLMELPLRGLLAVALMVPVLLLDVPLLLYGILWNQEVVVLDPERFSPLLWWTDFMNAGGRFVLTVLAVAASVAGGRSVLALLSPPAPSLPAPAATALPDAPPSR